ncbi:Quino protein amine dehydrogenase [Baffinella frigidus]|nr:Quino protein amine dehydrogenase [Cryptophyta sp. CCMP2293]
MMDGDDGSGEDEAGITEMGGEECFGGEEWDDDTVPRVLPIMEIIVPVEGVEAIVGMAANADGSQLLLSCLFANAQGRPQVVVWDVEGARIQSRLQGHAIERFITRCCFGGRGQMLAASGAEDGNVFVWHANSAKPVKVLQGHHASVTAIDWRPGDDHMLATGGDDNTVKIWGLPAEGRGG